MRRALVDVHPDGQAINLNDGIRRDRYRLSETDTRLIEPGRVYRYTIEVWPTSNLFKPGHRIRLEISSSNFPMYDRNPNTGDELGTNERMRPPTSGSCTTRGTLPRGGCPSCPSRSPPTEA